jgi:hypothetical protein
MKSLKEIFQKLKKSTLVSRLLQVVLVILLIIATTYISGPLPQKDAQGRIISTEQAANNTVGTPVIEIIEKTPTSGVIVAVIGVILIILAGTAVSMRNQK